MFIRLSSSEVFLRFESGITSVISQAISECRDDYVWPDLVLSSDRFWSFALHLG